MTTEKSVAGLVHVSKMFGCNAGATAALNDVTLEVTRGELVLLLGPSGSGKTTLLSVLAGLMCPDAGEVRLFGRRVQDYAARDLQSVRAKRIGFVFQNFLLLEPLTVQENIELVKTFCGGRWQRTDHSVRELLSQLGIVHLAGSYPTRMSQGEKQRAAIARALANGAELILADEPTASLESSQGAGIIHILRSLAHDKNRCVVVASHDPRLVECADRVVCLRDGRIERVKGKHAA